MFWCLPTQFIDLELLGAMKSKSKAVVPRNAGHPLPGRPAWVGREDDVVIGRRAFESEGP